MRPNRYPAPATPRKELAPHQRQAWAAFARLRDRAFGSNKLARQWLAKEMGIEDRCCIIADMDAVECETVAVICNERVQQLDAAIEAGATIKKPEPKGPQYLIRRRKSRTAHVWTGKDTACRMASTGGLDMKNYEVTTSTGGLKICPMCQGGAPTNVLAAG